MSEKSVDRGISKTPPGPGTPQRRQVTVLFSDMADYTPLAETLGEETTYRLMQRLHRELSEAVHAQDGTVQELTGDGVMALFGAPVAHEDAPLRACRAALDIQARMENLAADIEAEIGARPVFRVGLHSGPLVIGAVGDDRAMEVTALGDTVNLASRIEALADSGAVLMSEATRALVKGFVDCAYAGERTVKGKAKPQKLWQLDGIKPGRSRFDVARGRGLTPLVGRRPELEALKAKWQAVEGGDVHMVEVTGEAGIGKSRLVHEFRRHLPDDVFFLRGNCRAELRSTPFLPFIEIVRTSFRISPETGRKEIERRLARGLEVLGVDAGDTLPYLLNLLGQKADDTAFKERASETVGIRTRDAILALLRERCRMSPVVMLIEDRHWIDRASEELLRRSLSVAGIPRLLIVATRRPDYAPPWSGGANVSEVPLTPLAEEHMIDLLKARLGVDEVPPALADLIAEKAEGNPLFGEELLSYLQGEGSVRTDGDGVVFAQAQGGLPASLENLLMDRVDQLDGGARAVLEAAAVIGRRFSSALVAQVSGLNGETADHFQTLETAELILRTESDEDCEFKHALIRDAVYSRLLGDRRAELHGHVAAALEHAHGNRLEEVADALAHHYSRSEHTDKAVRYLALAGERSLGVYALDEAEARFQAVLDLLETHPDVADDAFLADVLLGIARVHYFKIDFGRLIAMVEKYLPRIEALGDKRRLSRFLFETGYAHVFGACQDIGVPLLERALALGEEIGDDEAIGYASLGLSWHYVFWVPASPERLDTMYRFSDRAIEIGRRIGDVWLTSKALIAKGSDAGLWGRSEEARQAGLALTEFSRETGDPRTRSMGLWELAYMSASSGEYEEAIDYADEALKQSLSPVDRALAEGAKGGALALSGRAAEATELLERTVRRLDDGQMIMSSFVIHHLPYGLSLVMGGRFAEGVSYIEDTARRYEDFGQRTAAPYADYFLGEIYLQMVLGEERPPLQVILRNFGFILRTMPVAGSKARNHLAAAVRQARTLDIPMLLAMSLYSLGVLDTAKKRPADARARLAEARKIAAAVEAEALVDKIDAALVTVS